MNLAKAIRGHRESRRSARALQYAINNAATPAMRNELVLVAQRADVARGLR